MSKQKKSTESGNIPEKVEKTDKKQDNKPSRDRETGGPSGPEPTRYGDWEIGGKCVDF